MNAGSSAVIDNRADGAKDLTKMAQTMPDSEAQPLSPLVHQLFTISVHDEQFSLDDVVLNLSQQHRICEGDLLKLIIAPQSRPLLEQDTNNGEPNNTANICVLYKAVNPELLVTQPSLQVSVSRKLAAAFDIEKGYQALVSTIDKSAHHATHVEIVFRDQYLARADMWRVVSSDLVNTTIYRGQKIGFLGSIRAQVKTIFVQGRKVQSALFHTSTRPIFRSESARYVLFIQMSKEMWDFDAEGTGEIMFDKVINGFLPELFKRWHESKVKHLVSIVLFTRMTYDERVNAGLGLPSIEGGRPKRSQSDKSKNLKDFYRVVVSDMASGDWATILNQLKREFKVFLRDISIRRPNTGDHLPLGEGLSSALRDVPKDVIAGHPSAASRGNILEAINLASSQFSSDYIDRDLVRTGVSIVVITPGAGVFEVDYNLLVATTDNLIDNGVGIDLVCLSRMPLHSVPLFKYEAPQSGVVQPTQIKQSLSMDDQVTPTGNFLAGGSSGTPPTPSLTDDIRRKRPRGPGQQSRERWSYGIPHWVDISFWTPSTEDALAQIAIRRKSKAKSAFDAPQHKTFIPRVKMYEIQMMGVMENSISDISIPPLSQTFRSDNRLSSFRQAAVPTSSGTVNKALMSSSFDSSRDKAFGHMPKVSSSIASTRSGVRTVSASLSRWMDDYDDLVFRHPLVAKKRSRKIRSSKSISKGRQDRGYSPSLLGTSTGSRIAPYKDDKGSNVRKETLKRRTLPVGSNQKSDISKGTDERRPKTVNATRNISFGPRGFTTKAVASTEVTTQHGEGSLLSRGLKSGYSTKPASLHGTVPAMTQTKKKIDSPDSHESDVKSPEVTQSSESESQLSRPIPIRNATAIRIRNDSKSRAKRYLRASPNVSGNGQSHDRLAALQDLQEREDDYSASELDDDNDTQPPPIALSPNSTLAPWLTLLNPSHPSKTKMDLANRLGRWQHLFPKPLRASQIKWKSLCSPAAVPLTTEEFPSAEHLVEEYDGTTYEIDLPHNSEISEMPRDLVAELLAFRLSRGFQIVVGPRLMESTKESPLQALNVFNDQLLAGSGTSIYLSRGSTIHKLARLNEHKIEIKQLSRRRGEVTKDFKTESMIYRPMIRSMMAGSYDIQEISITPHRSNFDWKAIDSFIVGNERPQAKDFVESLRPWRARFVLIPVEAPSSTRRRLRSDEDDEEEVRLEGIRKLTQVWQRFRYVPPDERRYQAPSRIRKDTNPLDIMYQTRNPSAIVAAELENVAEGDATGRPVQLLPESDLYQRSNFKVSSLAETIQGENGVRLLDRRWHFRLHNNCFVGEELTTWLLQNFRDVDTRDDAVDIGNELMKSGMFKHVEQRHNFRDGNYFYQIADEYRTLRSESRGWFGRGKASVPSTPMSEDLPKEVTIIGRSRSSSKSNPFEDQDALTPTGKKQQLGVALSKSLLYDVDHRKRSYRPELINLHYDRLHNPDNCYHIRVEWMNTTPKLIQDAVVSWATSVDRFGLRLVEVPIGEASSITSMHPFRAPYLIKLALQPPKRKPQSYSDSTHLSSQPQPEKDPYQKAIMKRFNFVLDFEAASDFPADVDVTYSWGKPDYRYPQYIHRSGMLIAQITDSGDFLVLANRLYNNRSATSSSYHQEINKSSDHPGDNDQTRGPGFFRSSPHRGIHGPPRPSPHSSPYNSPSVRATLDIPSPNANRGPSPTSATSHNKNIPSPLSQDSTRPAPITATTTPDTTKEEFEIFCKNANTLQQFYDEVLSKASSLGPNTPLMESTKTPNKGPLTDIGFNESGIPSLALPGSVVGRGKARCESDAKARIVKGGSPKPSWNG